MPAKHHSPDVLVKLDRSSVSFGGSVRHYTSGNTITRDRRTFEYGQHDLIEAPLFADLEQHLRQLSAQSTSVERRGDVKLVAVGGEGEGGGR